MGGLNRTTILLAVCDLIEITIALKPTSSSDSEIFLKLSYQSLVKATDGFSSANLIGEGSFGLVFKGVLDEGERTVPVKVLNLVRHGDLKSFLAECEALRNIRHRDLLKVLSVCSGIDSHGDDFKALIYKFMINGSLDKWLHPSQTVAETMDRPRSLSFSERLNIAIDVSMAVDYLHHHCETPIVHCDLKPSNVLLDDDMVGHVGDFGLVRVLPKASANQSSSVGVKGTIGYTPILLQSMAWGTKFGHEEKGMYSYGILVLEMFTGKRPTDDMFQGTSNLHYFVKAALPERMVDIVDPAFVQEVVQGNMLADRNSNEGRARVSIKIRESLISILEVGVA
ncbi:hypothetical protein ACLB2K_073807 [Fragaria x ananassa]